MSARRPRKRARPPAAEPNAIMLPDRAPWLEQARVNLLFAKILGELTEAEHLKLDAAIGAPVGKPRPSSPRRRIKAEVWHVVAGHLQREREKLPPDSPRVRPTLPPLRFLDREEETSS